MQRGAFGNDFARKFKVYEQYYCQVGLTGMIAPHTPTGSCLVMHMKLSSAGEKGSSRTKVVT